MSKIAQKIGITDDNGDIPDYIWLDRMRVQQYFLQYLWRFRWDSKWKNLHSRTRMYHESTHLQKRQQLHPALYILFHQQVSNHHFYRSSDCHIFHLPCQRRQMWQWYVRHPNRKLFAFKTESVSWKEKIIKRFLNAIRTKFRWRL